MRKVRRLVQAAPVWARQISDSEGSGNGTPGVGVEAGRYAAARRHIGRRPGGAAARGETAARVSADRGPCGGVRLVGLADRLTDRERMALTAWALRKVEKGTGKYAAHWRAEAQKAMRDAQGAGPVWIMPAHRVVESFDATTAEAL